MSENKQGRAIGQKGYFTQPYTYVTQDDDDSHGLYKRTIETNTPCYFVWSLKDGHLVDIPSEDRQLAIPKGYITFEGTNQHVLSERTSETIEHFKSEKAFGTTWNWDDAWDGKIVQYCQALDKEGLEVTRIYRKGKVQVRYPQGKAKDRVGTIQRIVRAIGNDFKELTFGKSNLFIHFDMGKPIKRWKGY